MKDHSNDSFNVEAGADVPPTAPAQLLQRDDLSRDEKIALLREWEQDAREQMVAEEENMIGSGTVAENLGDILAALAALGADREAAPPPTKHG